MLNSELVFQLCVPSQTFQMEDFNREENLNRPNTWTEFFCSIVRLRSSLILGALNERAFITVLSSLGFMNLNFSWKHDQRKGQIRNGEEKDKNDLCQPTL